MLLHMDKFNLLVCLSLVIFTVSAPKLVDISGDMETRQQEILHEEGARAGSATSQDIGEVHQGFPQGRQVTTGDEGRSVSGESVEQGLPPPTLILEENSGVVPIIG